MANEKQAVEALSKDSQKNIIDKFRDSNIYQISTSLITPDENFATDMLMDVVDSTIEVTKGNLDGLNPAINLKNIVDDYDSNNNQYIELKELVSVTLDICGKIVPNSEKFEILRDVYNITPANVNLNTAPLQLTPEKENIGIEHINSAPSPDFDL